MKTLQSRFTCMTAAAALLALATSAFAQNSYPNKPVNIVTAFAAGSGPDAVLRQVSE